MPKKYISISGYIGGYGNDYDSITRQLRATSSEDDIEIVIDSYGGDYFQGLSIYNALRGYRERVTIRVVGIAWSAASLIAMGGKKLIMPRNSFLMIHLPEIGAFGDKKDVESTLRLITAMEQVAANAYSEKAGMAPEEALALMEKETWLTAEEALAAGFADEITEGVEVDWSNYEPLLSLNNTPDYLYLMIGKHKNVSMENNVVSPGVAKTATSKVQQILASMGKVLNQIIGEELPVEQPSATSGGDTPPATSMSVEPPSQPSANADSPINQLMIEIQAMRKEIQPLLDLKQEFEDFKTQMSGSNASAPDYTEQFKALRDGFNELSTHMSSIETYMAGGIESGLDGNKRTTSAPAIGSNSVMTRTEREFNSKRSLGVIEVEVADK